jgi:hypothetical protein
MIAIALHDLAKVFGERGSPDFKVPLDLKVVSGFLGAYLQANPLEPAEVEALPALLDARSLKRAIGKYRSMIEEARVTQGHLRKSAQEVARVRWLEATTPKSCGRRCGAHPRPPRNERGRLDHDDVSPPKVGANGVRAQVLARRDDPA